MTRLLSFISNHLCLRQNPKSFPCTNFQLRHFSSDQFSGDAEDSSKDGLNSEDVAQNRIFTEATTISDGLVQNTLSPDEEFAQTPNNRVAEIAKEVSLYIRARPRWEKTLLSDFQGVDFADPSFYNEVLRQQNNAFFSIRFYYWLKSVNGSLFDPALSNKIFGRLVEAKATHAAKNFLEETGIEPEPYYLDLYIRCLCENGLIDLAVDVFELLERVGHCASLETWNLALLHSVRNNRVEVVWKLYNYMAKLGVKTNIDTIGHLIQAFCLDNAATKGYKLLQQVVEDGNIPDKIIFDKLISAYGKNRQYSNVSGVLHYMILKNVSPDIYTYQEIINQLCKGKLRYRGLQIFNELKDRGYFPDRVIYTTLIHGLCKNKDYGEARKLWFEMVQKGIVPNEYTYNSYIDGLWRNKCIDEAQKLHKEMLDKGYKETTVSYNIMIRGLCLNGKADEARALFEQMNQKGIVCDAITFNTLIMGFSVLGKTADALNFFHELIKQDLRIFDAPFTLMTQNLCRAGHVKDIERLWRDLRDKGFELPAASLNPIIYELSNKRCVSEGIEWLCYMMKNGVRPKESVLSKLVHYSCLTGKSGALFEEMNANGIECDPITLNTLVARLSEHGKLTDALNFIHKSLNQGLRPSSEALTPFMEKLVVSGKVNVAAKLWQDMEEKGLRPPFRLLNPILCRLSEEGLISEEIELLRLAVGNGFIPKKTTFPKILMALLGLKKGNRVEMRN